MNKLDQTKAEAGIARSRLRMTADAVKARLQPDALIGEMTHFAKKRAKQAVFAAALSKKSRPVIAVGLIVTGAAYLLRKPVLDIIAKKMAKETDNE